MSSFIAVCESNLKETRCLAGVKKLKLVADAVNRVKWTFFDHF